MDVLRTPDDRFADLPDYPFAPRYTEIVDVDGTVLRMHHIDEGPADGGASDGGPGAATILCLHGEPSWSFLYRKMIPVFTAAGHRVVAPDLIGFGKSDKPAARDDYTYQRHVDWLSQWLLKTDLRGITLVCQDWGGLLGLRLLAGFPERFARVVVANTALPTGDQPVSEAFLAWRDYSQKVPEFDAGRIVNGGTTRKISPAEIAAYNAPFPDARYQAGARQFPLLVPTRPDDPAAPANRAAWEVLKTLPHPVLTAFGADDRIMAGVERVFQALMPGAAGQPHAILPEAGHFLQEDAGPELAALVNAFIERTPQAT